MSTEMSIDAFSLSLSLSLWRPGHRESGIAIGVVSGQVELMLALISVQGLQEECGRGQGKLH